RTRIEIPAGTYAGQDEPIVTTSLPVITYTTTGMDDETAYQLTKAYWDQKDEMAETSAWWKGVTPELLANVTTELHPGAIRYYEERGIELDDRQK
ncbi:MAG TPA: TAXI family TRAP transporter solute-binding subunit, partial [Paracoccaceae bacterium]|nr:TAXI family TRAP transporter solute-binding subunit [Paracoccaceae bacterium]